MPVWAVNSALSLKLSCRDVQVQLIVCAPKLPSLTAETSSSLGLSELGSAVEQT